MSGRPHPETERPLRGSLQTFDIAEEVSRLRSEPAWLSGKRNAITLRKSEGMNVVLLVLRAGGRLEKHSAPGPILLNVIEGRVTFATPEETVETGAGGLISCSANVEHSVEAVTDAVCVLTISGQADRPSR